MEEVVVPTGAFEFSSQRAFRSLFLHGVDGHVPEHRQILWPVAHSRSVLVFVHDHVQPPVQAVFHAPVLANDLIEPLRCERSAEQVVCGFGGRLVGRFAYPHRKRRLRAVSTARSPAFMPFVDMACCHVCEGHGWKPLN